MLKTCNTLLHAVGFPVRFNITPAGDEALAVEVNDTRAPGPPARG
jgi:hypothetical protein